MTEKQTSLFETALPELPEGFAYSEDLIDIDEQRGLIAQFKDLPFKEFEFHGYLGKRRVVSYGWKYDFSARVLNKVDDIPEFLHPLRDKAAAFARLRAADLQMALVTEYAPGAGIGWHRDKAVFADVVGVSLISACNFRLRRKIGNKYERASITAEPRSVYLLRGPSRTEWEHSIPGVEELRYSITFRNFRDDA